MIHSPRAILRKRVAIALMAAAMAMSATPAMAQHDRHGGGGHGRPAYHGGGYHGGDYRGGYHGGGGGLIVGALLGAVAGTAVTSAVQALPAVAYVEPPPPPPPGAAYYPGSYAPGFRLSSPRNQRAAV
jgi:hypothetical protein